MKNIIIYLSSADIEALLMSTITYVFIEKKKQKKNVSVLSVDI